jgi:hypothetical protein
VLSDLFVVYSSGTPVADATSSATAFARPDAPLDHVRHLAGAGLTSDATVIGVRASICGFGVALLIGVASCSDLRDFRGTWRGDRIGTDPSLLVGALDEGVAHLSIATLDRHGLHGHVAVAGLVDAPLDSIPGAEADVLAGITLGSPRRCAVILCWLWFLSTRKTELN